VFLDTKIINCYIFLSTAQQLNSSTAQQLNSSTAQQLNSSTARKLDSYPILIHACTHHIHSHLLITLTNTITTHTCITHTHTHTHTHSSHSREFLFKNKKKKKKREREQAVRFLFVFAVLCHPWHKDAGSLLPTKSSGWCLSSCRTDRCVQAVLTLERDAQRLGLLNRGLYKDRCLYSPPALRMVSTVPHPSKVLLAKDRTLALCKGQQRCAKWKGWHRCCLVNG